MINDVVNFTGKSGPTYYVLTRLYDSTSGKFLDYVGWQTITGSTTIPITFNANTIKQGGTLNVDPTATSFSTSVTPAITTAGTRTDLLGHTVYVYEYVYVKDDDTNTYVKVASHASTSNTTQKVTFVGLTTAAHAASATGTQYGTASASMTIYDTMTPVGIVSGTTFYVRTRVYDRNTGNYLTLNGSNTYYDSTLSNTEKTVHFTVNTSSLAGHVLAIEEYLYTTSALRAADTSFNGTGAIATHNTGHDQTAQEIYILNVETTATYNTASGSQYGVAKSSMKIVDTISLTGGKPSSQYHVYTWVYDITDGAYVNLNGTAYQYAHSTITAGAYGTTATGTVNLTIDTTGKEGHVFAVTEYVYDAEYTAGATYIASHNTAHTVEAQKIYIPKVTTTAYYGSSGTYKDGTAGTSKTIRDVYTFTGGKASTTYYYVSQIFKGTSTTAMSTVENSFTTTSAGARTATISHSGLTLEAGADYRVALWVYTDEAHNNLVASHNTATGHTESDQIVYTPSVETTAYYSASLPLKTGIAGTNLTIRDSYEFDHGQPNTTYYYISRIYKAGTTTVVSTATDSFTTTASGASEGDISHTGLTLEAGTDYRIALWVYTDEAHKNLVTSHNTATGHNAEADQIVYVPNVTTAATYTGTDTQTGLAGTGRTIRDEFTFTGGKPNTEYLITSRVYEETTLKSTKNSGDACKFTTDSNGYYKGYVDHTGLTLTAGKDYRVTLEVYTGSRTSARLVATHNTTSPYTAEDAQRVYVPSVTTRAYAALVNTQHSTSGTGKAIRDVFTFTGGQPGATYYYVSKIYKGTGTTAISTVESGADGFTTNATTGGATVTVTHSNLTLEAGENYRVALWIYADSGYNNLVASHNTDTGHAIIAQRVVVPKVTTKATYGTSGIQYGLYTSNGAIRDTFTFTGGLPNTTYYYTSRVYEGTTLRSTMNGDDQQFTTDDDGTYTGYVDHTGLTLTEGKDYRVTMIVYTTSARNTYIAQHNTTSPYNTETAQIVYIPKITTSTANVTSGAGDYLNTKYVSTATTSATVRDTISYENLKPGTSYTVRTVVYDITDSTDSPVASGISKAETKTTDASSAATISGEWTVDITFNPQTLTGNKYVIYQYVVDSSGNIVGQHTDATDTTQYFYLMSELTIQKETESSYITTDFINSDCYDLTGTTFKIYTTQAAAQANTGSGSTYVGTWIIGTNGKSNTVMVAANTTYYARETAAGKGYKLSSDITDITVGATSKTETISNIPGDDPISLSLEKVSADGNDGLPLEGTEFTVKYYAGTYTSEAQVQAASPTRTWVIQTVNTGTATDPVYEAGFDIPGSIVTGSSNAFWVNSGTNSIISITPEALVAQFLTEEALGNALIFPAGTYVITETKAPPAYLANLTGPYATTFSVTGVGNVGDHLTLILTDGNPTGSFTAQWQLLNGTTTSSIALASISTSGLKNALEPIISTVAKGEDGSDDVPVDEAMVINDAVSYQRLMPNTTYTLIGTLYYAEAFTDANGHSYSAGDPVLDVNGHPVWAYKQFTTGAANSKANDASTSNTVVKGEQVVEFNFNCEDLIEEEVKAVVYEELYVGTYAEAYTGTSVYDATKLTVKHLVASHKVLADTDQQVNLLPYGEYSFFKTGEQFTDVAFNENGTVTFQYEEVGLSGVTFKVVAAETIRMHGNTYNAGDVIPGFESLTTDADGYLFLYKVSDTQDLRLRFGKYKLVELSNDGKHVIVNEETPFTVTKSTGKDRSMSGVESVDTVIENERKTITVNVEKIDSQNNSLPVEGAIYGLYSGVVITNFAGTRKLDTDEFVAYAVTDADGKATFLIGNDGTDDIPVDLPIGFTWYVKELYVPAGYDLDDTVYTVEFGDNQTRDVNIVKYVDNDDDDLAMDVPQPGQIEIQKTDTAGKKLSGVKYALEYSTDNGTTWATVKPYATTDKGVIVGKAEGVDTNGIATTGSNGKAIFSRLLANGTVLYRVTEIATQSGYQLLKDKIYVGTLPRITNSNTDITVYDVNGDGKVDSADVSLVNAYVDGQTVTFATGSGDVDGNGQITFSDSALIQDYIDNYVDITAYDINSDGIVDGVDLWILKRGVAGKITLPTGKGDINGDGTPDENDVLALQTFLETHLKHSVESGDMPNNRRYNLVYSIVDSRVFALPFTGSKGFSWIPFTAAGMLAAGGMTMIVLTIKRRKKHTAA